MIVSFVSVGGTEREFWEMSPPEYWRRMEGEGMRLKRDGEARVESAWLTAMLSRAEKVPRLEKLLRGDQGEKLSIEEGFARIRAIGKKKAKTKWQSEQ